MDPNWLRRMADEPRLPTLSEEARSEIRRYAAELERRHRVHANHLGSYLETEVDRGAVKLYRDEALFLLDLMCGVGVGAGL